MNKPEHVLAEILKDRYSWKDVKTELSKHNLDDRQRGVKTSLAGVLFEAFAKHYFLTAPEEKDHYRGVWYYQEIPRPVKDKLNLPDIDHGIDLLLEDYEGRYFAVQCKFRNDEGSTLSWSKDKIANVFAAGLSRVQGFVVFTNASDIADVIRNHTEHFSFYGVSALLEIDGTGFRNIYQSLTGGQLQVDAPKTPFPHQQEAIEKCLKGFDAYNRGQLILPCGAGKTLTALWIKERLQAETTLVLVPSLALLRQIKKDWARNKTFPFTYLCVCSEGDIDNDAHDSAVLHTYEVGSNVTTRPEEIGAFLEQRGPKVIYSTYQSLPAIERALVSRDFVFDFVFCDEAHKTAGVGQNEFSLIHDNTRVPALRRLYATATPRIVSPKLKNRLSEFEYAYDMSNPEVFGKEFYRMSFKDAIEKGILVDYKIIAYGVRDEDLRKLIEERRFTEEEVTLDELANNYALNKVMERFGASHCLTFHSRIRKAKEFCERHRRIFPDISSFSISGEQTTSERNKILNEFRGLDKSIISNAQCLTEGVDVPAIDLVYFCDPKNSKVDIVQATGRALRKKEGKKMGYVVVPIYHPDKDSLEECIEKGAFKNLIQVIRSLCDQDERLQIEVNQLALGKGKREGTFIHVFGGSFIEEKATIQLTGFEEQLQKALFEQVLEKISDSWEVRFGKLVEYRGANPKRWPVNHRNYSEEDQLGIFCEVLRRRRNEGSLSEYWIGKLDEIGFNWGGREDNWLRECQNIKELLSDKQEISVRIIGVNEYGWVARVWKKLKAGKLEPYQLGPVQELNLHRFFDEETFEDKIRAIEEWRALRGALPTKLTHPKLYSWLKSQEQRYKNGQLMDATQVARLKEIDPGLGRSREEEERDVWLKGFNAVKEFCTHTGSWPTKGVLYNWCQAQRQRRKGTASNGRTGPIESWKVEMLDGAGFVWDKREQENQEWLENLQKVTAFKEEQGRFPKKHENEELYRWMVNQKVAFKKEKLSETRRQSLDAVGFDITATGDIAAGRKRERKKLRS